MDDIDVSILKLLQKNSRISASDISGEVNLSVSAIGERLKKLEGTGVIKQYTAIINAEYLHKELTAVMYISLERPQFTNQFLNFVELEEEILECHYIAGNYDYIVKIVTTNAASLEKLLNRIKSVKGVAKTNTSIVLSTIKNKFSVTPV